LNSSLSKLLKRFISEGKTRFYLSEFVEESNVPLSEVENYFVPLLGTNKIEGKLEVRCPNCGKDLGIFNRLPEIPESIVCEFCGYEFSKAMEYVEIVLEVKKGFFRVQEESCADSDRESSH
jgi:predicted nucleic acid-binding Zn ribbon protein